MKKATKGLIMLMAVAVSALLVAPMSALAAEVETPLSLTTQSTTNPYRDVNSKTVDKTGINAVKYVKNHKGFKNVITGNRFYPAKAFTKAQFIKILQNLYGANRVPATKAEKTSKVKVTAKYATTKLQQVAKQGFGVKIKWKSGVNNKVLTRTGVANYIKVFATWDGGLFRPKQ